MSTNTELWDLYTASAEYTAALKDKFDRHPFWASKNRNIFEPTVSNYLYNNGLQPKYPNGKKFAVCLSHDIDVLYDERSAKQLLKNTLVSAVKLNADKFTKSIKAAYKREINPNYNLAKTFKIENKYGAKSSTYFLALNATEEDHNYHLDAITESINEVVKNKGEIGLHGGHQAYNDINKIAQEKLKLETVIGSKVVGYRNHYLRFTTPHTWEYLNQLGFLYDTTYGYADCLGFRNGMCYPFNPYLNNTKEFLNIVELPLVIMDVTLWGYMRLTPTEQLNLCKNLIDKVAAIHGVVTIVWHNTHMLGAEGALYEAIIKYAAEKGAWLTTAQDIVTHWQDNNYNATANAILSKLNSA